MLGIPAIDTGQVYMLPTQRRDVLEQMIWNVTRRAAQMHNRPLDVNRIPIHNRTDDEVQARCAKGLALKRPIADFASLMEEYRTFEFVRGLTLGWCPRTWCSWRRWSPCCPALPG